MAKVVALEAYKRDRYEAEREAARRRRGAKDLTPEEEHERWLEVCAQELAEYQMDLELWGNREES